MCVLPVTWKTEAVKSLEPRSCKVTWVGLSVCLSVCLSVSLSYACKHTHTNIHTHTITQFILPKKAHNIQLDFLVSIPFLNYLAIVIIAPVYCLSNSLESSPLAGTEKLIIFSTYKACTNFKNKLNVV